MIESNLKYKMLTRASTKMMDLSIFKKCTKNAASKKLDYSDNQKKCIENEQNLYSVSTKQDSTRLKGFSTLENSVWNAFGNSTD